MSRETYTKQNQRLITRPRVAGYMMELGYDVRPAQNPFQPSLKAWAVEDSPQTRKLIADFVAALKAEREERE